ILMMPDVANKLGELKLQMGLQFGGIQAPASKNPRTEMYFVDKTVRQILNEIVKKRGRGVWVYREYKYNGNRYFALNFLVQ
ncbi:MAG TPA: hypothetical protein VJL58_06030, partial [Pyrinomonadaceae bacterium]|nr:hypothetical protein [Pyrinomonadaceae bacterium]